MVSLSSSLLAFLKSRSETDRQIDRDSNPWGRAGEAEATLWEGEGQGIRILWSEGWGEASCLFCAQATEEIR